MKNIGKYKVLGIIGKGGMGIVYKALDPDIEREVAIKTIRIDTLIEGLEKEEMLTRVIREAKAAGRLNHPNIITVYDVVREKDLTYIVMQYVDGQSLQARIESGKGLSTGEIIDILKPVSDALDYAHRSGIVHRDIKPANILLDKSGQPFLADFGVARIETSTLTQAGTTVGTLSYMSPEQVKGEPVDGRSDIFALGVILYELLAGKKPFAGDNLSTIVYKIVHEEPQRITEINKELPHGYEWVLKKLLAKNPGDRYQTCVEMILDLENARQMTETAPILEPEKAMALPTGRKKRRALALAAAALGLVVMAGALYLVFSPKSKKTPPLSDSVADLKKSGISPVTRSGGPGVGGITAPDDSLVKLKESFDGKNFEEAARLAEGILNRVPTDLTAQDYLRKARAEISSAKIGPLLQSGIASFNGGRYGQCIQEMEKVLALNKENREAQSYLSRAQDALAKKEIRDLIELIKQAEENKDLATILGHINSPALAGEIEADYQSLFSGSDRIQSRISNISIVPSGPSSATARFSHWLTGVANKDGKTKLFFDGTKTWQLKKQGSAWRITGIK